MKYRESASAHRWCCGEGIEIGAAAHNPFGLSTINVDRDPQTGDTPYAKEQLRQCGEIAQVDVIASGDDLPFDDESQDFVVSSHVLEHFADPISALMEWDRVVRPGGVIYAIVPHKERTFDVDKERTTLAHLLDDFGTAEQNGDYGHHHAWITEDFVEVIRWIQLNTGVRWTILELLDVDDKVGNGFAFAVRKDGTRV